METLKGWWGLRLLLVIVRSTIYFLEVILILEVIRVRLVCFFFNLFYFLLFLICVIVGGGRRKEIID